MPVFEDENDSALFFHREQDDLAMYELSSPSISKNQFIYVNSRDDNNKASNFHSCSDDDSDVIAIGTTTTILSGKRHKVNSPEPAERWLHSKFSTTQSIIAEANNHKTTFYNKKNGNTPCVQNKASFLEAAKKTGAKSKPYYAKVFEGCNAFEPIEIFNDSDDDGDDYNLKNVIGYCEISLKNKNSAFKNRNRKIATKSTTNTTKSTSVPKKIVRKRDRSVFEKQEFKQKGSHCNGMKEIDTDSIENKDVKHHTISTSASAVTSEGIRRSFSIANSLASKSTTHSKIDVDTSQRNILTEMDITTENKEIAFDIDDGTTVKKPRTEVINLTDDDNHTNPPSFFPYGTVNRSRQEFEQCKNENFGNLSKEANQVKGTTRANPDTQDGKRSDRIQNSVLSEDNFMFTPIEEENQNTLLTVLDSPENISLLKIDEGIRTNQDEKKRERLKPLQYSSGGKTINQIDEPKAENGSRGIMDSEFMTSPTQVFIGKKCSQIIVKETEGKNDSITDCVCPKHQVEIIDVDQIEHVEVEVQNDKGFNYFGNLNNKSKGMTTKIGKKPRFKPQRNKKVGKSEKKLSNVEKKRSRSYTKNKKRLLDQNHRPFRSPCPTLSSCPTFLSCLKNEEHLPKKRISNYTSYNDSIQNDGDKMNRARPTSLSSSCSSESRYIFHPSNRDPEYHHRNNFLGMNIDEALKEQERLLQKAAARVRNQPSIQITSGLNRSQNTSYSFTFSTLMRNVHIQHPDHWMYRNLYSRLGLPRHANELMIKSQYRRLARVYHPDHNIGKPDTRHKFQAVTEAYNHLTNA